MSDPTEVGPAPEVAAATALLAPRSIAVVGASERSRWCNALVDNLDRHGFTGRLHLVNPKGGSIHGRTVAPSCAAIGEQVDLGVLLVPAGAVVDSTAALADAEVRSAMVLTSGFAETGDEGKALQDRLLDAARGAGVRLLGPNSLGFMNFVGNVIGWATPIEAPSRSEGVGLVSQSGATAFFLAELAHRQDIPLSHVVATGNEADLDCSSFAAALAADPNTRAVAMFVESVRNPAAFLAAARACRAADKPLIVLKVGASEVTARSALAHTGALVGDDRVFDGICEQYDIVRVHSLEELMTTADVIGRTGVLREGGLLVVSNSGGVCEIAADTAVELGMQLPELPAAVVPTVRDAMPEFATPHNPLDLTGAIVPADCEQIVRVLGDQPDYAAVLVPYYAVPSSDEVEDVRLADLHRHLAAGLRDCAAVGLLTSYTATSINEVGKARVEEFDLPYLACGMDRALAGLGQAFRWSRRRRDRWAEDVDDTSPRHDARPHVDQNSRVRAIAERPVSEPDTMALLHRHGVPVVPQVLVTDAAAAVAAANTWSGPSVLKIVSPDIAHKTEIGGVALDVDGDVQIAAAFTRLDAVGRAQPGARVDGVVVVPLRAGGVELFVGCSTDPVWGPVIAVGLGGILVEVLADVAVRPLPVDAGEVRNMLSGLRASSLLAGARGAPPADLDAVARAVVAIGDVALGLGRDLAALDVNPLWVRGAEVQALDALAVWQEAE